MAERLRDVFSEDFIVRLIHAIQKEYLRFDANLFKDLVYQDDWADLALKERMRRITNSLNETLPSNYSEALQVLFPVAPQFKGALAGIIFPDFVQVYGLGHFNESVQAMEYFTSYSTSEFAVRVFLNQEEDRMLEKMLEWTAHPNEHVRRLASEGSRPRLPWGLSVPGLKNHPEKTVPILERLKADESSYVRKSVANHLNDFSHVNPTELLNLASKWYGENDRTNWIVKHACRSLLKKGNQQAMRLFGFEGSIATEIIGLSIDRETISIGDELTFQFDLVSNTLDSIRVEYAIDYVKSNGSRSRKVFMLGSKIDLGKAGHRKMLKKHSFKDLSTRKHYPGSHVLVIIVNGIEKANVIFELN